MQLEQSRLKTLRTNYFLLLFIHFLGSFASGYLWVLADTTFLLKYPPAWVSYLFFFILPLRLFTAYLSKLFVDNSYVNINKALIIIFTIFCLSSIYFSGLENQWAPMFLVIAYNMISPLTLSVISNISSEALFLKELKRYSAHFQAGSAVGALLACLLFPFLYQIFSSIFAAFLPLLCYFLILIFLYPLKISETKVENLKLNKYRNYPLSNNAYLLYFITGIIYFILIYVFKNAVAINVTPSQLPFYLAWVEAIIYLAILIIHSFVIGPSMRYLGLVKVLVVLPIILGIMGVIFFGINSLAIAIMFYIVGIVVIEGINDYAVDLALNALPTKMRVVSKFIGSESYFPLGMMLSSLMLIVLPFLVPLTHTEFLGALGLVSAILSIFWWKQSRKVFAAYMQSLTCSFDYRKLSSEQTELLFKNLSKQEATKLATYYLNQPNDHLHLLGLKFLQNMEEFDKQIINLLLSKLGSSQVDVQLQSIKSLYKAPNELIIDRCIEVLKKAENPHIIWEMIQLIGVNQDVRLTDLANKWIKSHDFRQIYGFYILNHDLKHQEKFNQLISESLINSDKRYRLAAVQILGILDLPQQVERLKLLVHDEDEAIAERAQTAIANHQIDSLLPELIEVLKVKKSNLLLKAIGSFGAKSIPLLENMGESNLPYQSHNALYALSQMNNSEADNAILRLAAHENIGIRMSAASSLLASGQQISRSESFYSQLLTLFLVENTRRKVLLGALQVQHFPYLENEIKIKYHLSSYISLAWYTLYIDATEIHKSMKIFIDYTEAGQLQTLQRTLELLCNLAPNATLRNELENWEVKLKGKLTSKELLKEPFVDHWIKKLAAYSIGQEVKSDDLEKLIILRQVDIFKSLPAEALELMVGKMELLHIPQDSMLFSEGEKADYFYVIAKGNLKILRHGTELSISKEYDIVGELAILSEQIRLASAQALSDVTLLRMEAKEFLNFTLLFTQILYSISRKTIEYLKI